MNFNFLYRYILNIIVLIQLIKSYQSLKSQNKNNNAKAIEQNKNNKSIQNKNNKIKIIEDNQNLYFRYLRTMLKDSKKKIIMDWTAKAACSDMIAMFLQNMNIYQNINYTGFVHDYRKSSFYQLYGYVTKDEFYNNDWYKFKVVRNPYSRAVSSYFHIMKYLSNYFFSKSNDMIVDNNLQKNATFIEFYKYYLKHYALDNKNFNSANHVQPQSMKLEIDYYKKYNKSIYNDIVKLEDFDHDISIVNNKTKQHYYTGLYKDTHVTRKMINTMNITFFGNHYFSFFKYNDIIYQPSNYKLFYNEEIKDLISYLYAHDLRLYQYNEL